MEIDTDKKNNTIFSSAMIIAIITILSKLLGFARDAIIASKFGATFQTDAYFFASSLPGIPAVSMSFSTVFLPQYIQLKSVRDNRLNREYVSNTVVVLLLVAFLISLVACLLSPLLVSIFAPGFDEKTSELSIKFLRLLVFTLPLIMLRYMSTAILNANKVFGRSQVSGLYLNIAYILIILFFSRRLGIRVLLVASVVSSVIEAGYCILISRDFFSRKVQIRFDENIKQLFRLVVPVLIGNAIVQLHEIVDQLIGSLLDSGRLSILSYGITLSNVVKTVVVTSLASVYYPYASEYIAQKNSEGISHLFKKTVIEMLAIIVPITVISISCSSDIVTLVYGRGSFTGESILLTSNVLSSYAVGFCFVGVRELAAKTLYAMNRQKVVAINGAIGVFVNIILSYVLSLRYDVCGIAIATACSEAVTAVLLLCSLRKLICAKQILLDFLKLGVSGVGAFLLSNLLGQFVSGNALVILIVTACAVGVIYIIEIWLLKIPDALSIITTVRDHISKQKGK